LPGETRRENRVHKEKEKILFSELTDN